MPAEEAGAEVEFVRYHPSLPIGMAVALTGLGLLALQPVDLRPAGIEVTRDLSASPLPAPGVVIHPFEASETARHAGLAAPATPLADLGLLDRSSPKDGLLRDLDIPALRSGAAPATAPRPVAVASPPAPPADHVVAPGDTLAALARRYYGDIRMAEAIYRANQDRLSDPDDLRIGQTLRLPAAP